MSLAVVSIVSVVGWAIVAVASVAVAVGRIAVVAVHSAVQITGISLRVSLRFSRRFSVRISFTFCTALAVVKRTVILNNQTKVCIVAKIAY